MIRSIENLKYVKIESYANFPLIKVSEIEAYMDLIDRFKPDVIYVSTQQDRNDWYRTFTDEIAPTTEFLFSHNGIMYSFPARYYKTIRDLIEGDSKGFPNGKIYYEALEAKFINYIDYKENKECRNLGYKTKLDFVDAKNLGFVGCFKKWKKSNYHHSERVSSVCKSFQSDADIFYRAKEWGYKDFNEFQEAIPKGFTEAEKYRDAKSKGFCNFEEYNEAKNLKIDDKSMYDMYKMLDYIKSKYRIVTFDETYVVSILLSIKLDNGLTLEEIWEKLKVGRERYKLLHRQLSV
jgi:hypothetical protein